MKKATAIVKKRGSTIFLRLALIGLGGLVAFLGSIFVWLVYSNWNPEFPDMMVLRYPVLAGLVIAMLAFFAAAHQAWKLLDFVDEDRPFSANSITALKNIKQAAFVIGGLFLGAMPLVYWIAEKDDAPGLILFGLLFSGIPLTVAVFAGVLQQLIQAAIDLKSENDLTV